MDKGPWSDSRNSTDRHDCNGHYIVRIKQYSLTRYAEKLLARYYVLDAFWAAVQDCGDIEWAGRNILGCLRSQAYADHRELKDSADHGSAEPPLAWFRNQAMAGIHDGRINRGRETKRSPLAWAFFNALAGGEEVPFLDLSPRKREELDALQRKLKSWKLQVAEFQVYSNLIEGGTSS